ncbi:MAG: aspartyl protease family protein [Candidatus Eremiobacteraeota bacterium]|nr:aspartyl protease family protein [Candidatus Eremiobacteraeota bacterium]
MKIRCMRAALLGALAFLAATIAAAADDATTLLAKHKAYAGWQFGDPGVKVLELTETATRDSTIELRERVRRIGLLYRIDARNVKAGTDSSIGFTGNLFWYSDENGFTVPIIGDAAKVSLAQDLFFTDAVTQLPWTWLRDERRWNTQYAVIRAEQPNAFPLEIYVDPQTGAYGGATIDPKGDNAQTIRIIDYQKVANKHFINQWKFDGSRRTVGISDIKLAAPILPEDLHPPAQTAHWEFKNATPFPIRLTQKRIVIKARVNGVEGSFLLDSGAGRIFLSGAFARRAGIKATGQTESRTLYGTQKVDAGKAATIDVGGNILHDIKLYFGQPEFDAEGPDGLMGFALLAGAFTTLDFERSTLQLQDPNTVDPAAVQGVHVGVDLSNGTPRALMNVQGKTTTVNATIDTGDPRFALISDELVNTYGLRMTAAGVFGGCGTLDNMSIGPLVYDKPNACTVQFGGVHDALIGYDFLKGLSKVYFDYPRAMMILTPRAK